MADLYGVDWQLDLAVRAAVEEPVAPGAPPPGASSPESTGPAAGAGAAATEQGPRPIRIAFDEPIETARDSRTVLVELAERARKTLA